MPVAASTPPDSEGKRDRDRPADGAQLERAAADPLEVDLIAGEEEEHSEPEVGEEFGEVVDVGEAEDVRSDRDPHHQLEHDDGRGEALGHDRDRDRGDRGDHHHGEEGAGVDLDGGCGNGDQETAILRLAG
jgi:hypothetical protein